MNWNFRVTDGTKCYSWWFKHIAKMNLEAIVESKATRCVLVQNEDSIEAWALEPGFEAEGASEVERMYQALDNEHACVLGIFELTSLLKI